ncbi:T9SS type A sorting domain-containing protein [Chryseobacterium aahli]|uniref:RCC1 domain-containing protein n=1 Tax=Chryseobacterium aahli TaxID=1278643 RepID=UPI001F613F85|nr:T9SS type A sorting domain-containing protein [Chryseobacterium aahli]MCI3936993.1 T9SS type A sorting domain-containing protein [Chryseobacterium aahli]
MKLFLPKLFFILFLVPITIYCQCWKQISNGQYYSVAIKNDGTLWAWGANNFGQLGTGNFINSTTPIQIGTDNNWKTISSGGAHTLALKNDGTLWAWGYNQNGQLGLNSFTNIPVPSQVGTNNNWKDIFTGIYVSAAIKTDFSLWTWGKIDSSQLGLPTNNIPDVSIPTQVGDDTNWKQISFGGLFTIALKTDNTLWSWGISSFGELGNGTSNSQNLTPAIISNSTDWKLVTSGNWFSIAIKNNGTLWSWGLNSGQFGNGSTQNSTIPIQIGSQTNWSIADINSNFTTAIKSDGTLWGWGANSFGQLGNSSNNPSSIPIQIGNGTNWIQLSNGFNYSAALNSNNELWLSGQNNFGQIGNGNTTNINTLQILNNSCNNLDLQEQNTSENYLTIYPNPARQFININYSNTDKVQDVSIFDASGKKALNFKNKQSKIDISSLSQGLYYITVDINNKTTIKKFIKQ